MLRSSRREAQCDGGAGVLGDRRGAERNALRREPRGRAGRHDRRTDGVAMPSWGRSIGAARRLGARVAQEPWLCARSSCAGVCRFYGAGARPHRSAAGRRPPARPGTGASHCARSRDRSGGRRPRDSCASICRASPGRMDVEAPDLDVTLPPRPKLVVLVQIRGQSYRLVLRSALALWRRRAARPRFDRRRRRPGAGARDP